MRVPAVSFLLLSTVLLSQQAVSAVQLRSYTGSSKYAAKGLVRTRGYKELM